MQQRDPPAWRVRLSQWDMSHNAIPLALFAYTSVLQALNQITTPMTVPRALWYTSYFVSLAALVVTILITLLRTVIHPRALLNDFAHPRLVNFFFLPAIIGTLALLTAPPFIRNRTVSLVGFYILGAYQLLLVLYLFGEWLFATAPTVSIYPLVFMQTIAFFLLSILASTLNLPEQATASLSVGTLLWLLVFITNFQHVSGTLSQKSERPAPTFFLFIAPPAQGVIAAVFLNHVRENPASGFLDITQITEFPVVSEFFLYVDIFLYALMFRLFPTWWKSKFSVTWWAYVFPLSAAACGVLWKYATSKDMFFFVLSGIMFGFASVALVVVAACTVWAVCTGRLPKNPACDSEYRQYWIKSVYGDAQAYDGVSNNTSYEDSYQLDEEYP